MIDIQKIRRPLKAFSISFLVVSILMPFKVFALQEYKLDITGTPWKETPPPPGNSTILQLFRLPEIHQGQQGTLSVRRDNDTRAESIKKNMKQWTKDFPKYGIDVLRAEEFQQNGETAYVFDLLQKSSQKQMRQVVFYNSEDAVILTCTNHKDYFQQTGPLCDQVIKSFRWSKI